MQSTVGGATLGQVVLGSLRKQAEKAIRNKPAGSAPHGLCLQVPGLLEFLSLLLITSYGLVSEINSFLHKSFGSWCFITAIATLTRTGVFRSHIVTGVEDLRVLLSRKGEDYIL